MWSSPPGTKFKVEFPYDCPFALNPCIITDSSARPLNLPGELTVYKYVITVNDGPPSPDPHVVGGGG